jgi:2-polyprenyl-3-methyl-5-hydroxy-6-metoxy-1,4-benzoquinol methylase
VERERWPTLTPVTPDYLPPIRGFFDRQYAAHDRYWWRGPNRYSTDPAAHTAFNAAWLSAAAWRGPGRALDLGAGEGADAIRLARLGYQVDAIDASAVACEKAERFARTVAVDIAVRCEPIETASFAPHAHSHIKLVAARQPERTGTR